VLSGHTDSYLYKRLKISVDSYCVTLGTLFVSLCINIMPKTNTHYPDTCLMRAWQNHSSELRAWVVHRLPADEDADDFMQDLFLKSLRRQAHFCTLENARAWLFTAARNQLIDRFRLRREHLELPPDLIADHEESAAVDLLSACLPVALERLTPSEREVLTACDLDGQKQADYACEHDLTLPAVKARLRRARQHLKACLLDNCQVRFDTDTGQICCFARLDEVQGM
jgi:RNA polymerase sigma-70 factor, ECF subfamily